MLRRKRVWIIIGILVALNVLAWSEVFDLRRQEFLEVTFFDVGQGDAIFIETPKGHQVLIDGGPSNVILEKLSSEMPFYDKRLDLVILTHPDHDHYFGLLEVLKNYRVDNVLWTGVIKDTAEWKEWKRLLEEEGAEIRIAEAGQEIRFQDNLFLKILFPLKNLKGQEAENVNDTSIVAKLVFKERSFLFTGDITDRAEHNIVGEYGSLKADVLKISHHGSGDSSSEGFLKSVSPVFGVVQVGKDNNYGHPDPEVLARLEEFGIEVLRTDEQGDIKFISEGKYLKLKTASEKISSW